MSRRAVAICSLIFTYLFFAEYLSPFRKVHIPYDLDGFHYPLIDYAFLSLKQGRFPLWDPTIYSGMSFVGNIQAALFYPPTWLLFAANIGKQHVSYQSLQVFVVAHVWLAFLLCYLWLLNRNLSRMACALGAGVFAFSGYLCDQLQHQGMVTTYAWFPLALWGIDRAAVRARWEPFWMVAAASALALLAGYPPTWVVLAVALPAYALFSPSRWRTTLLTLGAILFSLILAAVQLLPSAEATSLMIKEQRYGSGLWNAAHLIAYLSPSYYNYDMNISSVIDVGYEYLYLGAPAFLGLAFLARKPRWREIAPFLAVFATTLTVVMNPFNAVWAVIQRSSLLAGLLRDWYFLAGITLAIAPLVAYGWDSFFRADRVSGTSVWNRAVSRNILFVAATVWAVIEIWRWSKPSGFAHGPWSALDVLITLVIAGTTAVLWRAHAAWRPALGAVLLLSCGVDYKAYGTSKWVNASPGSGPRVREGSYEGFDPLGYAELRAHPEHRVLLDEFAPFPGLLRHSGWRTPQGFDPLLPARYKTLVEQYQPKWLNDREFTISPFRTDAISDLGVGYYIVTDQSPHAEEIRNSPQYRRIGPPTSYFKVYAYASPQLPYGWQSGEGEVEQLASSPEARQFRLSSKQGGRFILREQMMPGWQATLDGARVIIELYKGALQSIVVPQGTHVVKFQYKPATLVWGSILSGAALLGLLLVARKDRIR